MSAFVVDKKHIDLMVSAIVNGTRDGVIPARPYDPNRIGQMFVSENVESVSYRYPRDNVSKGELPGPGGPNAYYLAPYTYADPVYRPTSAELYMAIRCLDYQSCEHPGWQNSEAYQHCRDLQREIESKVPAAKRYREAVERRDYNGQRWGAMDAAPWEFSELNIAILYAKWHDEGKWIIATALANRDDPAPLAALSDWLMERGLISESLSPRYLDNVEEDPATKPKPTAPPVNDRDDAIRRIRQALRRRSGKAWSVTGGRGTAWGWITITAPPRRQDRKSVV